MIKFKRGLFGLACGVILFTPCYGSALINGSQLHLSGDAIVGATFLNWNCDQVGDSACPDANHGDFTVSSSTGTFAQYNNSFGLEADINNAVEPLNTPFSLTNFITFELNGNETIELNFIPLGNDPISSTCAGLAHCTPQNNLLITPNNPAGLSAFNLDQNALGTAASFGVVGIIHDISGATAAITGIYSAEFVGETPQQVLASIGGGTSSTYSANLALTITPEPAAMTLIGAGLLALGLLRRRQKA